MERNEILKIVRDLKEELDSTLAICMNCLEAANYDVEKAKSMIIERTAYLKAERLSRTHFGKTVVSTNLEGTEGIILALGCQSAESAKTEIFKDLCDLLDLTCSKYKPKTAGQLMGCELLKESPAKRNSVFSEFDFVDEAVKFAMSSLHENIDIKYYNFIHAGIGAGEFTRVVEYSYETGLGVIGIFHITDMDKVDKMYIVKRILGAIARHNPLCIHENMIPEVIKDTVIKQSTEEKEEGTPEEKYKKFLSEAVLDNMMVCSPGDEQNDISIKDLCEKFGITIFSFDRFKIE